MEDLIRSYRETYYTIISAKKRAEETEREYLAGMASDVKYVIEWLETGRQPGNRRGVERRAVYQRTVPIDPIHFQRYLNLNQPLYRRRGYPLTNQDMWQVENVLSVLTPREREVYVLSRGQGLTFQQIASLLGVSRSTVGKLIERAEGKIRRHISSGFSA